MPAKKPINTPRDARSRLTGQDSSSKSHSHKLGALLWRAFGFGPVMGPIRWVSNMKIKNSLKALKGRHRDCQLVRRKGRVYIINKTAPRYKARQG